MEEKCSTFLENYKIFSLDLLNLFSMIRAEDVLSVDFNTKKEKIRGNDIVNKNLSMDTKLLSSISIAEVIIAIRGTTKKNITNIIATV